MLATQQESLVPVAITQAMVGRMILTTRVTSETLKEMPANVVRRDASVASGSTSRAGTKCPCCDQPVDVPSVAMIVGEWGLSPLQARILEAVWKGKGYPVSTEAIFNSMFRDDPDGGPTEGKAYISFKVALHYMRLLLDGSGIGIKTVGYRRGFSLTIGERTASPDPSKRSWNLRDGGKRARGYLVANEFEARYFEEVNSRERRKIKRLAKAEAEASFKKRLDGAERERQRLLERLAKAEAKVAAQKRLAVPVIAAKEAAEVEAVKAPRAKKTYPNARGERHHAAKLTAEQARAIRAEWQERKPMLCDLAARYGVSKGTIKKIVSGVSYQNA